MIIRLATHLLLCVALMLLLSCRDQNNNPPPDTGVEAPSGQVTLSGQVNSASGAAIADAVVMVMDGSRNTVVESATDEDGLYQAKFQSNGGPAQRYLVQIRRDVEDLPVVTGAAWTEDFVTTLEVTVPTIVVPDMDTAQLALIDGIATSADGAVELSGMPENTEAVFAKDFDPDVQRGIFPGDFRNSRGDTLNSAGFFWFSAIDADGVEITEFDTPPVATVRLGRSQWQDLIDLRPDNGRIDVPMYSFDEGLGQWVSEKAEDGEPLGHLVNANGETIPESSVASIRRGEYVGTVSVRFAVAHFSYWNLDYAMIEDVWGPFISAAQEQGVRGAGDTGDAVTDEGEPYPEINHSPVELETGNPIWLGDWVSADVDPPPAGEEDFFDDGVLECTEDKLTIRVNNQNSEYSTLTAYINVVVDYNGDGDFADAGEWIVKNDPVEIPGNRGVSKTYENLPDLSSVWLRVTAVTEPVEAFTGTGLFLFGETEDYYNCPGDRRYEIELRGDDRDGNARVRSTGFDNIQFDCGPSNAGVCNLRSRRGAAVVGQPPYDTSADGYTVQLQAFDGDELTPIRWVVVGNNVAWCQEWGAVGTPRAELDANKYLLYDTCTISVPLRSNAKLPLAEFPFRNRFSVGLYDAANSDGDFVESLNRQAESLNRIEGELRLKDGTVLEINCGAGNSDCAYTFFAGQAVSLTMTAIPAPGVMFAGWRGCDQLQRTLDTTCTISSITRGYPNESYAPYALFGSYPYTLTLSGQGSGAVGVVLEGTPFGEDGPEPACVTSGNGAVCEYELPVGLLYRLRPRVDAGSRFGQWLDSCQVGTVYRGQRQVCSLSSLKPDPRANAAEFDGGITIGLEVTGAGFVSLSSTFAAYDPDPELDCIGSNSGTTRCEIRKFEKDNLRVIATIPSNSNLLFIGWEGACAGAVDPADNPECVVEVSEDSTIGAIFATKAQVDVSVDGPGSVNAAAAGIQCSSASCSGEASINADVEFIAQAQDGAVFVGWTGDCANTSGNRCTLTADRGLLDVGAQFLPRPTLTLQPVNGGIFATQAAPAPGAASPEAFALDCAAPYAAQDCIGRPYPGSMVQLSAYNDDGWRFVEWTGACAGTPTTQTCTIEMSEDATVGATFAAPATLTVNRQGPGRITGDGGIDCGNSCAASFQDGSSVTLIANADPGANFTGWTGACASAGTQTSCTLSIGFDDLNVGASFEADADAGVLTLTLSGDAGYVFDSLERFTCSSDNSPCTVSFAPNESIVLDAYGDTPGSSWSWGGDCTGTPDNGTCALTMDQARDVTVNFVAPPPRTLTLNVSGSGSIGDGGDFTCTSAQSPCSTTYRNGDVVSLRSSGMASGDELIWGDACQADNTFGNQCVLTMDQDLVASAQFVAQASTLSVSVTGDGTVASADGEIVCTPDGSDCSASYPAGSSVTLTASPTGMDAPFAGWSGACANYGLSDECTLTLDGDTTVGALFQANQRSVEVRITGSGSITDALSGQVCDAASAPCLFVYNGDQSVQLTPGDSSNPVVWGEACAGYASGGRCDLYTSSDQIVSADFTQPGITLTLSVSGDGLVFSEDGRISCTSSGGDCSADYVSGQAIDLNASETGSQSFSGWSGDACSTESSPFCGFTLTAPTQVNASFQ